MLKQSSSNSLKTVTASDTANSDIANVVQVIDSKTVRYPCLPQ